ncbi:RDD family protein [Bacillus sp. PS06]|uniref:RDD family protein n=1 Tax=Bacillus sp. PS06 TaxID=2764176 RepID=UPI001780CA77|nr:RDD family protein [Bacillus sp. PS06]MBD8069448.1 RDD family protein [Bacillus sp. PS06]
MSKKPAGFGIRVLADFLDFFILSLPIALAFYWIKGDYSYEWAMGWTWQIIYTIYMTALPLLWSGYIIGKRMFNINIRRMDEGKLTFKNMFLREFIGKFLLMYVTLGISSIVSVFMLIFRKDKRTIHDLIARTYVSYGK